MFRRLAAFFGPRRSSHNNNKRQSPVRRNNNATKQVRSPSQASRNKIMVMRPNGTAIPVNMYNKWKNYQRLLKSGYSNAAARRASGYQ